MLSEPILKSEKYDRRLLLSAFLHELIHCYLFIQCGFEARRERGHTKGFHIIAGIIDKWVGEGYLSLCSMKANLDYFRRDVGREMEMRMRMQGGLDLRGEILDPRGDMGIGMGRGLAIGNGHFGHHGHEGCNQSPRPESGLVADVPDLRLGYYY